MGGVEHTQDGSLFYGVADIPFHSSYYTGDQGVDQEGLPLSPVVDPRDGSVLDGLTCLAGVLADQVGHLWLRQVASPIDAGEVFAVFVRTANKISHPRGISVDDKGGIYCVTSKYMRKVVWDGKKLSDKEEDGAWKSEYDYVPNPKALSRGSGNTPTLMGFGPDDDKLVVLRADTETPHGKVVRIMDLAREAAA